MDAARIHLDSDGDHFTLEHVQHDVQAILDRNAALRAEPQKSDWGRHIASIPNLVILQWANEEWQRGNTKLMPFTKEFDETVVAHKLRDPDWKWLRVDK